MKQPQTIPHELYPDTHHDAYSRTTFGFWVYLMSDFILFGALFATYAVLSNSTFGGPSGADLFTPSYTLVQTLIFLVSSFIVGLAGAAVHRKHKSRTLLFFGITFLLGLIFLGMQFNELAAYARAGNGWNQSAFLSIYFTIIGTHMVHVVFGLLWIIVLLIPVLREESISHVSIRRITCLRMFWQFLNIVWVFIFSFVYLMGVE